MNIQLQSLPNLTPSGAAGFIGNPAGRCHKGRGVFASPHGNQRNAPVFLRWYLDEQVVEEKAVGDVIAKLRLVGRTENGSFHLDNLLGERATANPPA